MPRAASQPPAEEVTYYYADQGEATHLRHYWNILVKRSRSLALIFLGVVALGGLYTLTSPRLYTAQSVLKIEPQNPTVTGVTGVGELGREQAAEGPYDYYRTQFALLKSEPLSARARSKRSACPHWSPPSRPASSPCRPPQRSPN